MRVRGREFIFILASAFVFSTHVWAQSPDRSPEIKDIQTRISWYRAWLEQVGASGSGFWLRLDSSKRPHRLYVGETFLRAEADAQEELIEIFSRYLAGHPDKNMLIDIYNASDNKWIGEYGFGGFRLFNTTETSAVR